MIKWFHEIDNKDFSLLGGKAYFLSAMFKNGIHVPNGFVIPSTAYDAYLWENGLNQKINHILGVNDSSAEKSRKIKLLFDVATFPDGLKEEIISEFNKIANGRAAVRSSSTQEDLPGMSFGGQYNSYLNVRASDLIEKVVLCWQSLWNERAVEYRAKFNLADNFTHSVIIQEMVESKLAGVIFTANPVNGIRNEMLINVSYGLGEAVVSGAVNPDQYTIDLKNGNILKEEIASKEKLCQYSEDGVEYVPVDESKRRIGSLNESHIKAIVEEVAKILNHFGKPQDIEFAFDENDVLYILQSRDITTLYPIDNLDQDGKLRAYLSAGTILLGMKEPFTPLGFDMFSQMFPTMINTMTMRKKPLDNHFVKYTGCRLYVDMTYLLSSKFVSKQFANAFSDNDLPLRGVLHTIIHQHGRRFGRQGIRFKIPWGILKYGLNMSPGMIRAGKTPSDKRYTVMIQLGEACYQKWNHASKNLATLEEKIAFIDECMAAAFVLSQKQALYATDILVIDKIKKSVKKMYGNQFNLEHLIHSLPGCVTQELTMKMNLAAKFFDENGLEPTADHPKIRVDILEKFGHRGNTELDIGTARWSEDPAFIVNQIKSYMTDRMYDRNLASISEKGERAEALIEKIYQAVKRDKGERRASKLRNQMTNYRIAAGMREYPKFNISKIMGISRKVLQEIGEEFEAAGLIDQKEDIFFLFKADILSKKNLKEKIEFNKANYQKEMGRMHIPRIILNSGETYYSSQSIHPNSKVIQGMPLSPGVYEGTIRVVLDPLSSNLAEGEIMVTESTNPAWTPLFAIAKGLILEYGGPISHGGIVAREYGVPAVVGIPSASSVFKNGQRVRINGETGLVEIL
jgi:rifampicin phosphotransferase